MGKFNVYYHPTLVKLKEAWPEDRYEIAVGYIDECVKEFMTISNKGGQGNKLLSFFRNGYKNWSKIVHHSLEIKMYHDDGDYVLVNEMFYEYIYKRLVTEVSRDIPEYDFTDFDVKMKIIYNGLGWEFDGWET